MKAGDRYQFDIKLIAGRRVAVLAPALLTHARGRLAYTLAR